MSIVETFGNRIQSLLESGHIDAARTLLKVGWRLQGFRFRYFGDKRLLPSDRILAANMIDAMYKPLAKPSDSAVVSIFVPCEMLFLAGLHPYSAEAMSSYITGTNVDRSCIRRAEGIGISEGYCSYHRILMAACDFGLIKTPKCIVYTNLVCDANMITFRRLSEKFRVPTFFLDIPRTQDEAALSYVEGQMRSLKLFLEDVSGRRISEEELEERVKASGRTLSNYWDYMGKRSTKHIPSDVTSPMYLAMANNILLGTKAQEEFSKMQLLDVGNAPYKKSKHIYFMHTIPVWSRALKDSFSFNDNAVIIADELGYPCHPEANFTDPYRAMAHRLLYSRFNGTAARRIDFGIEAAKHAGADGVIWFNHWGCKNTQGPSMLAKKRFEEAGIPLLTLDGDGCDSSFGGESQMSTRINAFLEMLG